MCARRESPSLTVTFCIISSASLNAPMIKETFEQPPVMLFSVSHRSEEDIYINTILLESHLG